MALVIGFAVSWIVSIVGIFYTLPFFDYLQPDNRLSSVLGALNILFIIGIPIVAIVLFIARLLFGTRMQNAWRLGMLGFFFLNVASFSIVATNLIRQFSAGTKITREIDLSGVASDTLSITLNSNPYEEVWQFLGDEFQITDEELVVNNIHLDIEKSSGEEIELIENIYSRGNNMSEANLLAGKVNLDLVVAENGVQIPANLAIPKGDTWRHQHVSYTLKVPEGKSIRLDGSINRIFHSVDIDDPNEFHPWDNRNEVWTMGEDGLACTSCLKDQEDSQLSYKDFSKLKIDGKMKVYIDQGDQYKVRLTGRKHYTEKVDIIQMEETLIISTELEHTSSPIRLYITMPQLASIDSEDTDDIRIQGFKAPSMTMSNRGRYEVKAYIDVDSLMLTQIGRNELDIRGNCNYLNANLRERARLDAEKISIREVDISATEASRAKLAVIETIRQQSDERSKITVEGNPSIVIQQQ